MSERARPRPSPRPTSPENLSLTLSHESARLVAHLMAPLAAELMANQLLPQLADLLREQGEPVDGWLDSRQAADYLQVSLSTIHRLTAARSIPFEQSSPGSKCYFRRADLDAWRSS